MKSPCVRQLGVESLLLSLEGPLSLRPLVDDGVWTIIRTMRVTGSLIFYYIDVEIKVEGSKYVLQRTPDLIRSSCPFL